MTDMFTLLSLPETSKGFTITQSSVTDNGGKYGGSSSPPRKTPRLDTDLDSGSASRKRHTTNDLTAWRDGPIYIQLIGAPINHISTVESDPEYRLLKRSITGVLTRSSGGLLPAAYGRIYNACRATVCTDKGEGLYSFVKLELEKCVGVLAKDYLDSETEGMKPIVSFVDMSKWFETQVALLHSLLTYLNQLYVVKEQNLPDIRKLSFSLFTDRIFQNPRIMERLRECIDHWVTWDRSSISSDEDQKPTSNFFEFRQHLLAFCTHLMTHGQYSEFEAFYLQSTNKYYKAESVERAEALKNDARAFFLHVIWRIENEEKRTKELLPMGSWAAVREVTERALLEERTKWVASGSLGTYIDAQDMVNLETMYNLFMRVDGLAVLSTAFRAHVQTTVQNIVKDASLDDEMVQRLLDFKAIAEATISTAFADASPVPIPTQLVRDAKPVLPLASVSTPSYKVRNQEFIYALADAFTTGFKARRNKPAEMIAKYLDRTMRKGQRDHSDAEFEEMLDGALGLYRYTDDKDVFRTFYHRALAKRLLLEKSASDDFEKRMLKKLEEEYDPEFGMGEHMFKDLALSRELTNDYHKKLPTESPGHKLSVMVLQQSFWPFSKPKSKVDLPPHMQAELTQFTEFYKVKHQGHVLDWDHALGTVTMKARFLEGFKELSLSLYQAVVLLLFNNNTSKLKYPEILAQTRMDDEELRRTLQSLACGKKKVLRKVPVGKDIGDDDVFHFNANFTDPRAKVHINSIQAKGTPEESKRTQISIEGDRNHTLDAAIVRIMKSRKELSLEKLKAATIDAVKSHFVPSVDQIKKRIDALIEQEYLARDEENMSMYVYLA